MRGLKEMRRFIANSWIGTEFRSFLNKIKYRKRCRGYPYDETTVVSSATEFQSIPISQTKIRINWKNPIAGPWDGIFIQMSTSKIPGTGCGIRIYTGAGVNPNQPGGYNYIIINGLRPNTTYYFTCTSYAGTLPWGESHNVSTTTIGTFMRHIDCESLPRFFIASSFVKTGEGEYYRIDGDSNIIYANVNDIAMDITAGIWFLCTVAGNASDSRWLRMGQRDRPTSHETYSLV